MKLWGLMLFDNNHFTTSWGQNFVDGDMIHVIPQTLIRVNNDDSSVWYYNSISLFSLTKKGGGGSGYDQLFKVFEIKQYKGMLGSRHKRSEVHIYRNYHTEIFFLVMGSENDIICWLAWPFYLVAGYTTGMRTIASNLYSGYIALLFSEHSFIKIFFILWGFLSSHNLETFKEDLNR